MPDLLLLLLAVLIVPAAIWLRVRDRAPRRSVSLSRMDCEQVLALVKLLQQHRGMSSAILSGDRSFEPATRERRRQIDLCIGALSGAVKAEAQMPRPCITHNDLALFRHRWADLLDKLPSLSTEQNIALHSQLIGRALDWLAAFGEARIELPARGSLPAELVRNYTRHLPALAECLGQIHAIGSGAAAQGTCSPVARVRLMYLVTRAGTLLGQAGHANADAPAAHARERVDILVATVRRQLLSGHDVTISAEQYFAIATGAVDAVYAWVQHCGELIGTPRLPLSPVPRAVS